MAIDVVIDSAVHAFAARLSRDSRTERLRDMSPRKKHPATISLPE